MIRREKVKDIVEVRRFTHLSDFAADPALTIASYHFTDLTSDLMGTWIEAMASVRPGNGRSLALAGLRGVGKSHFLAVLSAVASRPELRTSVRDPHIEASLARLHKRPMPVALVQRGSSSSLISELRTAVSKALSIDLKDLSDSLTDILIKASELSGETPVLIIIDTALGREARVDRDDGPLLSEIAEAAKNLGLFVGIALDDDVSGADGPNSSIARSFQIHFLDQDHLYRIVDRHIFPKNDAMLPLLKDIYSKYQSGIPGFKWSEQRFVPLYPMHPAAVEISPLIRLFVQDFALLGFASEAGMKIMGRPADSLIGLDEMFSSVEGRLRKDPHLEAAFATFDKLDKEVIQKEPVQFRLKAKLILTGLFLLSLNGQGASASVIAASMMVFDDQDPASGLQQIEGLLGRFAASFPDEVQRNTANGASPHYCLRIAINDRLEEAIDELRATVSDEDIWNALVNHVFETFPEIQDDTAENTSKVTVEWRGAFRRGVIRWQNRAEHDPSKLDWEIRVLDPKSRDTEFPAATDCSLRWLPADLTADERDAIAKFLILRKDGELRQKHGDGAVTAQLLSSSVNRTFRRIFFEDAVLKFGDREFGISEDLDSIHNVSQLLTKALAPVFDHIFDAHPYFLHSLGPKEVSQLTSNFFGRADTFAQGVQNLAQLLLEPLGLTEMTAEGYIPASSEKLLEQPLIRSALSMVPANTHLPLSQLASHFGTPPYGLSKEAEQLILTALVSQRVIDFITATENRISYRSLDLQIIWDDVIGVSLPVEDKYSSTQISSWFKTITGIDMPTNASEEFVLEALGNWVAKSDSTKILDDYERLPDEGVNSASWRKAASIRKSLGSVSETINAHITAGLTATECISAVADVFVGSESEFKKKRAELGDLESFADGSIARRTITEYLAKAELTENSQLERARNVLLHHINGATAVTPDTLAAWERFHNQYKEFYLARHRDLFAIDRPAELRKLFAADVWQKYQVYSQTSVFDKHTKYLVERLLHEYRHLECRFPTADSLEKLPICYCGLRLEDMSRISRAPGEIAGLIDRGLKELIGSDGDHSSPEFTDDDKKLVFTASIAGIDI